jgi:hypothetical protein
MGLPLRLLRGAIMMMGININDKTQDFTAQILRGEKTVETRRTNSLRTYVGQRVGIVRTGRGRATLVGYATIGEPIRYETRKQFAADYARHRVAAGSPHDCGPEGKFGYVLIDVEATPPRPVTSRGVVARKI